MYPDDRIINHWKKNDLIFNKPWYRKVLDFIPEAFLVASVAFLSFFVLLEVI